VLVVLYLLAASLKLDEGWSIGTYFSSMRLGLPLCPDALIPLATNAAILLETVGSPLLLLSSRPRLARAAFWTFVAFHIYSIAIVGIQFSVMCLMPLIALFGPRVAAIASPFDRRAIVGWALLAFLVAYQSIGLFIPGASRITGEGLGYGLSMFDANHQCQWDMKIESKTGAPRVVHNGTTQALKRCDPYREWFSIRTLCARGATRVAWTYDHSINGGPFYRIVDTQDACALEYRAFGHNAWIRSPDEGAAVIGYPVKNVLGDPKPIVVLHDPGGASWAGARSSVQDWLAPASDAIVVAWTAIWSGVVAALAYLGIIRPLAARWRGRTHSGREGSV
jgi:hypothetical protein